MTLAEGLVQCLRGEKGGAQRDFGEFWHTRDGVHGELHVVGAVNALAIKIAVANAAGLGPLVVPFETEMPVGVISRRRG